MDWMDIEHTMVPIRSMKVIQALCHKFEWHGKDYLALCWAKWHLFMLYKAKMSDDEFAKKFHQLWDVLEQYGGLFGNEPALLIKAYVAAGLDPNDVTFVSTAVQWALTDVCIKKIKDVQKQSK